MSLSLWQMLVTVHLAIVCYLACLQLVQMEPTTATTATVAVDLARVYNVTDWKAHEAKIVSVDATHVIDHYYGMPLADGAQDMAKAIVSNAQDQIADCIVQFFKGGQSEKFHPCVDQVVTNSVTRLDSLHSEEMTFTSGSTRLRPGLLWF